MSEEVVVERVIAAPPERVWSLVSDVTRMGEWSPETTSCDWQGGATAAETGARFRGRNRVGKRSWSTQCVVTECEPGRSFGFDVKAGPMGVAHWEYRIEPTDDGCRVEERWTDQRNAVIKWLGGLVSGVPDRVEHNRRGMEQTLEQLAVAAEEPAAERPG